MEIPALAGSSRQPVTDQAPPGEIRGNAVPLADGAKAGDLDTTTATEQASARVLKATGRALGMTVATLGTPSEAGFWLKTPLVSEETPGVVRSRDTGKRASVTLIPIDGPPTAGSRLSLPAMRLLELPLTALAELDVSTAG